MHPTRNSSPTAQEIGSASMCSIRTAISITTMELTPGAQDLIVNSWHPATTKQYQIHLHKWNEYCKKHCISPYFASVTDGINFLSECYDNGYSYSGLNTAQSALSSVLYFPTSTFGSHSLVNRLEVFNNRPCFPKYKTTWDVNLVLAYLKQISLDSVTLKQLSQKCVMLLALLTGQRIQTLQKIKVQNVSFNFQGCEIYLN